jgi:hypothetical protein
MLSLGTRDTRRRTRTRRGAFNYYPECATAYMCGLNRKTFFFFEDYSDRAVKALLHNNLNMTVRLRRGTGPGRAGNLDLDLDLLFCLNHDPRNLETTVTYFHSHACCVHAHREAGFFRHGGRGKAPRR